MIDYVLSFTDEAAAREALPTFVLQSGDWDRSRVTPNMAVACGDAVLSGFLVLVSTDNRDRLIETMPECQIILNRDTSAVEQSPAPGAVALDPAPAGSSYGAA